MKIALDPGHGGMFPGAIGLVPFELREKDVTLAICLKIGKLLKSGGHQAILTRSTDQELSPNIARDLELRAEAANRANADLLVSVHCNAFSDPNPEGVEVWYRPNSQPSENLARALQQALVAKFSDHLNRGIKPKDLLLFRHAQMPACHVETEFITNPVQLEFLASVANREALASAIAQGLLQFAAALSKKS